MSSTDQLALSLLIWLHAVPFCVGLVYTAIRHAIKK